ncbi:hypothetical protein NPIL_362961, partial [Nephila pilipes]
SSYVCDAIEKDIRPSNLSPSNHPKLNETVERSYVRITIQQFRCLFVFILKRIATIFKAKVDAVRYYIIYQEEGVTETELPLQHLPPQKCC